MNIINKLTNKQKIIALISIIIVLLTIIGFTFAYYVARIGDAAITDLDVTTAESARLVFTPGEEINIVASVDNFIEGGGNLYGETTSIATMKPGSETINDSDTYYVYYVIDKNEYVYTTAEKKPEMILTITDNEGNPITEITGFNYVTTMDAVTDETISGFDITDFNGVIPIKENVAINATYPTDTIHNWTVKITFVNLTTDQELNEGKELTGRLILQNEEYKMPASQTLINSGLLSGELIQHTSDIITSAGDNNYRYSGANPNNWVCFGSDETTCPEDNLYRILGIYNIDGVNKLKLIKETGIDKNANGIYELDYYGTDSLPFDSGKDNRWEGQNLNDPLDDADINIYLNNTYYNSISNKYQNMISEENYYIGGITWDTSYKAKDIYSDEIVSKTEQKYKVGLMYPSDYLYGTSQSYWGLLNYEITEPHDDSYYFNFELQTNNWIKHEEEEWTMVPQLDNSSYAWFISGQTCAGSSFVPHNIMGRPVLYLKSNVNIISGTGTESEPFRLSNNESETDSVVNHTVLDYISSTGTQYIDTGILLNQNSKIVLDFSVDSLKSNNQSLFGARDAVDGNGTISVLGNSTIYIKTGTMSGAAPSVNVSANTWYSIEQDSSQYIINGEVGATLTSGNYQLSNTTYLFAEHNQGNTLNYTTMNVKKFEIYDNNNLIMKLIPVQINDTGVICMYDEVSGKYFYNEGTGNFLAP